MLGKCDSEDRAYIGNPFTRRRGDIREKQDHSVCNVEWENKFLRAGVIDEEHVHSDHCPLILDMVYFDGNMFNHPRGLVK